MSEKRWICATCSEGFTRSYSADRHIWNLHSGLAKKVRLIDYMAGRASGEYFPADPSIYRANKKRHSMLGSSSMSHENISNYIITRDTIHFGLAGIGISKQVAINNPTITYLGLRMLKNPKGPKNPSINSP